jgi:hypothetical protein
MQNTSHAVMAQRFEDKESYDDFPTPPWATRALVKYVIGDVWQSYTCLEPGCGAGYMSRTLREYFGEVEAYDAVDYGNNEVRDFLTFDHSETPAFDWIITNPPFKHAEEFIRKALTLTRVGVAIFARTSFVESVGRYERLFKDKPPSTIAFFTERVPINKNKVAKSNVTATCYSWLVWMKYSITLGCEAVWIPPCRAELERDEDYTSPPGIRRRAVL